MASHDRSPVLAAAAHREPVVVGDVLLALGDSIAAGIGAGHVSEGCMPVLVENLRESAPRLRLVTHALPGESTSSMLRPSGQIDRTEATLSALHAEGRRVAPVCMCIGANDAMEAQTLGDEAARLRFRENLETILRRLDRALEPHGGVAELLCLQTIYNPFELDAAHRADDLAPRRARRGWLNPELRLAAARHDVVVADVDAAFRGRAADLTWVRSGDIHPSPAGHAVIAATFRAALGLD